MTSPSTIVVPFVPHANELRRSPAFRSCQILTVRDLISGMAQRLLPPHRIASPELTRALVASLLRNSDKAKKASSLLGPNVSPSHLARALDKSIGLLAQSDVSPQTLDALSRSDSLTVRDKRRAALLSLVIRELQNLLSSLSVRNKDTQILDGRFLESVLADSLTAQADTDLGHAIAQWLGPEVRVSNVLDLPPSRLRFFEALARLLSKNHCRLVFELPLIRRTLSLNASSDAPDSILGAAILRRIEGGSYNEAPELRPVGETFAGQNKVPTEMAQCVDLCYSESRKTIDRGKSISIRLVKSTRDEAEVVANEVARALHDFPDVGPEDIAVALGDLDVQLCSELNRCFSEIGVPIHLERSDPPESTPLITWFFRLCEESSAGTLRRSTLLDAVASGFGAGLWIHDAINPATAKPAEEAVKPDPESPDPDADPFPDFDEGPMPDDYEFAGGAASALEDPFEIPINEDYFESLAETENNADPSVEPVTETVQIASLEQRKETEAELQQLLRDLRQVDLPILRNAIGEADALQTALARLAKERESRFRKSPLESSPFRVQLILRLCTLRDTLLAMIGAKTRSQCLSAIADLALSLRLAKKARSELGEAVTMLPGLRRTRILRAAARDQEAVSALDDSIIALREANAIAGLDTDPADIPETLLEIREALAGRSPRGGSSFGSVLVERIARRIGRSAEVLIVAASHEGSLPLSSGDDPLLTSGIIAALRDHNPQKAPQDSSVKESSTLVAGLDTIGLTKRRLVIVTRIADTDGSRLPPSPLVSEIAFRSGIAPAGADLSDLEKYGQLHARTRAIRPFDSLRTARDAELSFAAFRSKVGKDPSHPSRESLWSAQRAWIERARQTAFSKRLAQKPLAAIAGEPKMLWPRVAGDNAFSTLDGQLRPFSPNDPGFLKTIALNEILDWQCKTVGSGNPNEWQKPISATTVEAYAQCHFRGWIERGLRASTTEEAEEDVDARARGSFIHDLLQAIYSRISKDAWDPRSKLHKETDDRAEEFVDEALNELQGHEPLFEGLRELDLLLLKKDLAELLRKDLRTAENPKTGYRRVPSSFELSFGDDSPALLLKNANGTHHLAIRGRIDRVDRLKIPNASDGYVVIDYKSSTLALSAPPLLVTSLQLPIYALALRSLNLLGAEKGSFVDAAFIGYKKTKGISSKWACQENARKPGELGNWEEAMAQDSAPETSPFAQSLVALFEKRLRAGYVSANGPDEVCEYCRLRTACRKPLFQGLEESTEADETPTEESSS